MVIATNIFLIIQNKHKKKKGNFFFLSCKTASKFGCGNLLCNQTDKGTFAQSTYSCRLFLIQ